MIYLDNAATAIKREEILKKLLMAILIAFIQREEKLKKS